MLTSRHLPDDVQSPLSTLRDDQGLHVPPLRPLTMEGRVEGEDEDPIPETSTNHAQPKQASPRELGKLLSAAVGQMFYR